ncbi:ATP-dependent Clp protease adapter protein ClpS [Gluconacetobacter sp. SXCC-1]|nr:ATP-dependent Clp protease adapter ClpS [Komagataeibacter xylinus]EGG75563.1 ATP-dependent Clp protease adapter protein ClpS [Gluconacetobacter sp. SXCC-1]
MDSTVPDAKKSLCPCPRTPFNRWWSSNMVPVMSAHARPFPSLPASRPAGAAARPLGHGGNTPPRRNGGGQDSPPGNDDGMIDVVIHTRPQTRKPAMYKVLMLNDDYTPMEFVVHVLERFFQKNREEATDIMLHVHKRGVGVCGVFTYEVAETKVTQVMDLARQNQHPLQCTIEKD